MAVHSQHHGPGGRVHFHPWGLSTELPRKCIQSGTGAGEDDGDTGGGGIQASGRATPLSHGSAGHAGGGGLRRREGMGAAEARRFSGGTYGNLTGPLYSLERIIRKLGHGGRTIDMLKIDCEGCEWDALHHLATRASPSVLARVDAIYLELHLGSQMQTDDDYAKWATMCTHHPQPPVATYRSPPPAASRYLYTSLPPSTHGAISSFLARHLQAAITAARNNRVRAFRSHALTTACVYVCARARTDS